MTKTNFSNIFYQLGRPVFYITFILTLFTFLHGYAQEKNLVPNGSFEEYYQCPISVGAVGNDQLERCKYWYKPTHATTDYYNACQTDPSSGVCVPSNWFGWQQPFEGEGYIGLGTFIEGSSSAEYVQCKLLQPLEACKKYHFSMRVSLADFSSRSTNTLGVRFDKYPITYTLPLEFIGFELPASVAMYAYITDTVNWVLFSGSYIAEGGEQFLTIGRFVDTSLYSNSNVPNIPVNCDSCFGGLPEAYYYVDSVTLVRTNEMETDENIPNILTVNGDGINDYWHPNNACLDNWSCEIFNRWGNKVFQFVQGDKGWNGKDKSGNELTEGEYFYRVFSENKEKTGFIQLVK
ncbi:gliding motility-associated C-terminal domain-containing protein [Fluviicola sp.]|uniref:gliding motility-associated C-terminal domain-containing protein n=1 Tax=Fluviicola sp. TaxID=1917219 RepID=UPI0031DE4F11